MWMLSPTFQGEACQHIEADPVCALILQMAQGTTLMEAYSCNIQVTEILDVQKDPNMMLVEDCFCGPK